VIFRPKQPFETIHEKPTTSQPSFSAASTTPRRRHSARAIATTGQNTNPWLHFGGERD